MVKTSPSNTEGEGSIPGGELRSHLVHGQKNKTKQKQYCNKFNEDFKNCPLKKKKKDLKKKREREIHSISFQTKELLFSWSFGAQHSCLDCKELQPVHSEGDQPWEFFGRNDAKAETPVLWPPHAKS